jgi:hypothetical protein
MQSEKYSTFDADTLEARIENGTKRYYLKGHRLDGGEWVALWLYDHSWLRVIFSRPGESDDRPEVCLPIFGRNTSLPRGIIFALPEDAILYWTGESTRPDHKYSSFPLGAAEVSVCLRALSPLTIPLTYTLLEL